MSIIVEHDKRKHEILQKSLDVFIEEGYEDATFQKIADRCGITRTTLYIYFKNKYEIFLGSIKELLSSLEAKLVSISNNSELSSTDALRLIFNVLVDECEKNKKLFSVLLNYLMQLKKSGEDPNERVHRRVIKLRHLLSTLMIRGIRNGEFKNLNVKMMNDFLYIHIEAAIFRLVVLNQSDISDMKNTINIAINCMLT